MTAYSASVSDSVLPPQSRLRRIATIRGVLALVWAAAVIVTVGKRVPTTATDLPKGVAALLALYPLIAVVASLAEARSSRSSLAVLRLNAAVSTAAVVAIALTAFGSNARATLVTFGAWAAVSGIVQLSVAIHRRRIENGQLPMIVSGGLSTIAGLGFIAQSGQHDAHLAYIGGYMAFGALFILVWSLRVPAHLRQA